MSQLEEIKARAEKATPGPWEHDAPEVGNDPTRELGPIEADSWEGGGMAVKYHDADFIAHARTDIPKLIAALEAVEALTENFAAADGALYDDDFNKGHCTGYRAAARLIRQAITEALA